MLTQVACPACGIANRINGTKELSSGKCGACGASLSLDTPIDVSDDAFSRHLAVTKGPVIVDVWAPWCGPCRLMAPNFEGAARQLVGIARLIKLNADEIAEPARLNVRGIPALIMFQDGKEISRQTGLQTRERITAWARKFADAASPMKSNLQT
jgi:thioredoxin 2